MSAPIASHPHDYLNWAELGNLLYDLVNAPNQSGHRGPDFYAGIAERFVDQARLVALRRAHDLENEGNRRAISAEARAQEQVKAARLRYEAAARTIRQDLADEFRDRANNPRHVTGKQRRDGVLLAAEWLAPARNEAEQ